MRSFRGKGLRRSVTHLVVMFSHGLADTQIEVSASAYAITVVIDKLREVRPADTRYYEDMLRGRLRRWR